MNIGTPSPNRRSYDNTLRLEQAKQTRERILESAVKVIESGGWKDASLAKVARAAGVSEPTLYRHFGSRERLLEELDAHVQGRMGFPSTFPEDADQLAQQIGVLFGGFEQNASYLRASMQSGLGREIRARGKAGRHKRLRGLVERVCPGLAPAQLDRVTGVLRVIASWEAFDTLTRELGLTSQEAGEAVGWALRTLLENPPAKAPETNGARSSKRRSPRTSAAKQKTSARARTSAKEKRP